jgi:hypothetical protein
VGTQQAAPLELNSRRTITAGGGWMCAVQNRRAEEEIRVGGISALVLGVAYIAIFPLFARVGAPPSGDGGEARLKYLEGKTKSGEPLSVSAS